MNADKMRIKIAEFCGWNVIHSFGNSVFAGEKTDLWYLRKGDKLIETFHWNNFKGKLPNPDLKDCLQSLPNRPTRRGSLHGH